MGGMRFSNLRIAWTVFWGLCAVLLIALWVRSHRSYDTAYYRVWPHETTLAINNGVAILYRASVSLDNSEREPDGWEFHHQQPGPLAKRLIFSASSDHTLIIFPIWPALVAAFALATVPAWRPIVHKTSLGAAFRL
jgi:hypothetical protein